MERQERTEVLVVGAGPVGMLAALVLAKEGVRVRVIDQATRTTSRTYACALHPRTLMLLNGLGLADEILQAGQQVDKVAFYSGATRQAEADFALLSGAYPCVVVLPQSALERLLEDKLRKEFRVSIAWNHQLSDLRLEPNAAVAAVDRLGVSAKGYIVPEMEWEVEKTEQIRADYVIGADGPNSHVAKCLSLGSEFAGEPEFYAVYEFESDWPSRNELRVALMPDTLSVLWPLPNNKFRWSFQLLQEHLAEFPAKDRSRITVGDPGLDVANREFMRKLVAARAPWFNGTIQELGWSTDVEFRRRLIQHFGERRCWLAGDAAHQTGPAGMQSMNLGLVEAAELAGAITQVLKQKGSPDLLGSYSDRSRGVWQPLLGMEGAPKARTGASPWIKENRARLLSCLPASGDHLAQLLSQLQLDLP